MTMEDSSDLGMAAGETSVLICVAVNRSWGRSRRKALSCSSRAVAGDLPEGNLWRTTSKIFTFINMRVLENETQQAHALPGRPRLQTWRGPLVLHVSLPFGIRDAGAVGRQSRKSM